MTNGQWKIWMAAAMVVSIVGCSQSNTPQENFNLLTVDDKPLPAVLFDGVLEDPGAPPYRFRIEATEGYFKLEGTRYQQVVEFRSLVDGKGNAKSRWADFGTCSPSGEKFRCESGFFQNYSFDLTQQSNRLLTQQQFNDPLLRGAYVFAK